MVQYIENLDTSDVGSMPLDYSPENFEKATYGKINSGLDWPSYPQFSGLDMNMQFFLPIERLGGEIKVKEKEGRAELTGQNLEVNGFAPEIASEFVSYLKRSGLEEKIKGKRAPVTGPFTLATRIGKDLLTSAASMPEVINSLSRTLNKVCHELTEKLGYEMVCIDEPMLSVILSRKRILFGYDKEFITSKLDEVLEGINGIKMVHVCGKLPPLAKEILLESKAEVLDHEFADYPVNFKLYQREELESYNKIIGLGCVSSKEPEVEDIKSIEKRINRGLHTFGPRLLIDPDCGMGSLPAGDGYDMALRKLKNMVAAARRV